MTNKLFCHLTCLRTSATSSATTFGSRLIVSMSTLQLLNQSLCILCKISRDQTLIIPSLKRCSKEATTTSRARKHGTGVKHFSRFCLTLVVFRLQLSASPYSLYVASIDMPRRMLWLKSSMERPTIRTSESRREMMLSIGLGLPWSHSRNVWRAAANWAAITYFTSSCKRLAISAAVWDHAGASQPAWRSA